MAEEIVRINSEKDLEKKKLDESWSQLPPELLQLVSIHLFAEDFRTFRSICKSWRSIKPTSRQLLSVLDSTYSQIPCLMSVDYYKCSVFHPIYHDHMNIPELCGATIRYSKYGWLLLSRSDCSVFFFHPFNKIKIELPGSHPFGTMCFSSPPTSADCLVIGVEVLGLEVGFIRRGELDWTICQFRGYFGPAGCNPVIHNGKCYCLSNSGNVGVFDINECLRAPNQHFHHWTIVSTGLPEHIRYSHQQSYMMEGNGGKLLAVFEVHDCEKCVYVFELNLSSSRSRMKWHEVRNLENKMLYVSPGGSFLESARVKGMGNKIYLPNVQDNRNVFYSLQTKKYHSFFSDYSTRISSHGKELNYSTWIIPITTTDKEFNW